MTDAITSFNGPYRFLSNFWPCNVMWQDVNFTSVEAAYQAAKSPWKRDWHWIAAMPPGDAKRAGRQVQMRSDWDQIKLDVMRDLISQKFAEPSLRRKLMATGEAELIEGNYWGDTYWGVCRGVGQNHLGKLLMAERSK